MSKKASNFQKAVMSLGYRGKEIFKPLNTGRIDDRVACVREWIANIFFYTKNGTTIMIDAGYNYERLGEKMGWLNIDPASIQHILITHQDTDHVGAVERDSDGLFRNAKLYLSEIENRFVFAHKDQVCNSMKKQKPHDPNAPYDGYDEREDTEYNAKNIKLAKAVPVPDKIQNAYRSSKNVYDDVLTQGSFFSRL